MSIFKNKEPRVYHLVNSLMRGNFDASNLCGNYVYDEVRF